jgi:DNA-directed RNA polymerase subunit alpha
MVTILLNLKQLRFKLYTEEPQKAKLSVKGEKVAKGSDFNLSSQLELVNKETQVATLTSKKAELEIEILVERGLGYEPVESRKKGKLETGTIAIDAIFTPVRKVSYRVENMRVGERTDFDRLFLELETDGTVSPEQAFSQASEILVKHFSLFEETFPRVEKPEPTLKPPVKKRVKKHAKKRKKTK